MSLLIIFHLHLKWKYCICVSFRYCWWKRKKKRVQVKWIVCNIASHISNEAKENRRVVKKTKKKTHRFRIENLLCDASKCVWRNPKDKASAIGIEVERTLVLEELEWAMWYADKRAIETKNERKTEFSIWFLLLMHSQYTNHRITFKEHYFLKCSLAYAAQIARMWNSSPYDYILYNIRVLSNADNLT